MDDTTFFLKLHFNSQNIMKFLFICPPGLGSAPILTPALFRQRACHISEVKSAHPDSLALASELFFILEEFLFCH